MIRVGHLSSKGTAPPRDVAHHIANLILKLNLDILTTTEIYNRKLAKAVRAAMPPGWRVSRRGEYLHCWRRSKLRTALSPLPRYRRMSWAYEGRDTWRDAFISTRHLIERGTGQRWILDVGHLQAGVESGNGWRRGSRQVVGHQSATARWGRLIARRRVSHPRARQMAAMDSNLDQHVPEHLQHLVADLGLPSIWQHRMPKRGTHAGGRLIDTVHTDARVLDAQVSHIKPPDSMDHAAIWCELAD